MDIKAQISLIKKEKGLHRSYYCEEYQDVGMLGMDPVEHYVKYGAQLGRNPRKTFDTKYYVSRYPDVVDSGLNPLVHFLTIGQGEGRESVPPNSAVWAKALKKVRSLRRKLQTLGFVELPIAELERDMNESVNPMLRQVAALELAASAYRKGTTEGYEECLSLLGRVTTLREDAILGSRTHVFQLMSLFFLGKHSEALSLLVLLDKRNQSSDDVLLAAANFAESETNKLNRVNQLLGRFDIPRISLRPMVGADDLQYDRLICESVVDRPVLATDPLLTVLIAAFNCASTISVTLNAIQAQTWKRLEIIVIDDCSTDDTCDIVERYALDDKRIKLLRLKVNSGAYVARNAGLDLAGGEFVTIHDADDWSHPLKFEFQLKALMSDVGLIGCTTQQARATSEFMFTRVSGSGSFLITNTSSFMFRREPVVKHLGYWDAVRFAADNELIRRIQKFFGEHSIAHLKSGPFSFQRDSDTSIVAHEYFGIAGLPNGVRQEYIEAQHHYHQSNRPLKYTAGRAFSSPYSMWSDRENHSKKLQHFDVIITSDFRMHGGSTQSNREEMRVQKKFGLKTAIFQMYRYDVDPRPERMMIGEVRDEVDGDLIHVLTYGQEATCDLLIIRYPPVLQNLQRFLPKIKAKAIHVIVNQPPMSDYTEEGVLRYRLEDCERNIQRYFGGRGVWYPIGPLVREALTLRHAEELKHIDMSPVDWLNIIDIDDWYRGEYVPDPTKRIKVGRHSRDNFVKWPSTKADVLAAYPDRDDVEVHVLGGSVAPQEVIGYLPKNWVVHAFNSLEPSQFLAQIDVFIYFSHPDWIESFGRTILEAMAVGVPVIIPADYKELFGSAAIYATPQTAMDQATKLFNDPDAYVRQSRMAVDYVNEKFGHKMHMERLRKAGVRHQANEEPLTC